MSNTVFKAIAHPARRQILSLLQERPMSAGEIAGHFDLAKSTLAGHFNVLKNAGLIQEQRQGNQVFYGLNLLSVAEELLALVTGIFGDREKGEAINQTKVD